MTSLPRIGLLLLILAFGSLLEPATGQAQSRLDRLPSALRERLEARQAEEERPIDLQRIQHGARVHTEAYGDSPAQQLDVYVPPGSRDAPILVMVHGGGWMIGDKANTSSVEHKLEYWLPRGWVVVSINYRMLPDAMALEQAQDVADALKYVQANAGRWDGDAGKIILMGHSAGGHLAAVISSRPDMVGRHWAGTVVLDAATLDVASTMTGRHPAFYGRAFGSDPTYWAAASPIALWTRDSVPMMLVCSVRRPDRPCDDAGRFQSRVEREGGSIPVLPLDLNHADINIQLGQAVEYTQGVDAFMRGRVD